MNPIEQFKQERAEALRLMSQDEDLRKKSVDWMLHSDKYKYTYNFTWMGRPIIKYPQDIQIMQELIWDVKPDLIIETGIAHGGSIIFSSSMMELLGNNGKVIAVDIKNPDLKTDTVPFSFSPSIVLITPEIFSE